MNEPDEFNEDTKGDVVIAIAVISVIAFTAVVLIQFFGGG